MLENLELRWRRVYGQLIIIKLGLALVGVSKPRLVLITSDPTRAKLTAKERTGTRGCQETTRVAKAAREIRARALVPSTARPLDQRGVAPRSSGASLGTLHRAPVGQGPSGPDWLAISFGFWSGRALATGTAWAGLCLIHHHHFRPSIY